MDLSARDDVRSELDRNVAEHRPIAAAIADGDGPRAEALMREHVISGAAGYRDIFARARRG
jgi:DNA-binding GntR family transcriptional regulator